MKKHLLIIGICIVLLIPISSAVDVNTNVDDILEEKTTITDVLDNDVEIISFFSGECQEINKIGFVYNEPIEIYPGNYGFDITGFKYPSGFFDFFF